MARIEKTVFLSYRRADSGWATAIHEHLTHRGFDVLIDTSGISSGAFEPSILEKVRTQAHFLIVLTPTALDRCEDPNDCLLREVKEAIEYRRNIVPLFVDGFSFADPAIAIRLTGPLLTLSRYNGLNVPPDYFKAAMERLCRVFLGDP